MLCCPNCTQTADALQSSFRFPRLRNQLIAAIYIGDVSQQEIVSTHRDPALAFFTQTGPLVLTWLVLKGLYLLKWSSYILRLIWMWLMLMHLKWYWLPSHLNAWMCFISNITRRTNMMQLLLTWASVAWPWLLCTSSCWKVKFTFLSLIYVFFYTVWHTFTVVFCTFDSIL